MSVTIGGTFSGLNVSQIIQTIIQADSVPITNLQTDNTNIQASNTALSFGPGPVNIAPAGATNVTVDRAITGTDAPRDCTNAWVTF